MLPFRCRTRALLLPRKGCPVTQKRTRFANHALASLKTNGDTAERLAETKLWHKKPTPQARIKAKEKGRFFKGDRTRINITNEDFIDEILNYIKPSLMRHEGCDLIDLNPGAGVWSTKLHDLLRPRAHILMEPDTDLYESFLKPLTERPGVVLLPESGIVWKNVDKILTPEFLPHQVEQPRTFGPDSQPPTRNDTLLVTANLSMFPSRKFLSFDSLALMVAFQLVSAIRAGGLFQKYGQVRMLLWMSPADMRTLFPRSAQIRRRGPIDAEVNTEWIREVVGPEYTDEQTDRYKFQRDSNLEFQSAVDTVARMREQGLVMPAGRETVLYKQIQEVYESGTTDFTGYQADPNSRFSPHVAKEAQRLEEAYARGEIERGTPEYVKLTRKRAYRAWIVNRANQKSALLDELEMVTELFDAGRTDDAVRMAAEWNKKMGGLNAPLRADTILQRDNLHLFRKKTMHWDRRPYEPLVHKPTDFFPNYPCSLFDIQPKVPHWLLRDVGRHSLQRGGEHFDLILRHVSSVLGGTLSKTFAGIWPGIVDGVLAQCPSLHETKLNGSPVPGYGELTPRCLNEHQWAEIMERFFDWPFKPSFQELVNCLSEELNTDADDEIVPSSLGKSMNMP